VGDAKHSRAAATTTNPTNASDDAPRFSQGLFVPPSMQLGPKPSRKAVEAFVQGIQSISKTPLPVKIVDNVSQIDGAVISVSKVDPEFKTSI
jgi:hypothetical protein